MIPKKENHETETKALSKTTTRGRSHAFGERPHRGLNERIFDGRHGGESIGQNKSVQASFGCFLLSLSSHPAMVVANCMLFRWVVGGRRWAKQSSTLRKPPSHITGAQGESNSG